MCAFINVCLYYFWHWLRAKKWPYWHVISINWQKKSITTFDSQYLLTGRGFGSGFWRHFVNEKLQHFLNFFATFFWFLYDFFLFFPVCLFTMTVEYAYLLVWDLGCFVVRQSHRAHCLPSRTMKNSRKLLRRMKHTRFQPKRSKYTEFDQDDKKNSMSISNHENTRIKPKLRV